MRCPVRCLRAIMHDPSKCLKACLQFLTPLAVTPLPPPPGILNGISTLTFTKNLGSIATVLPDWSCRRLKRARLQVRTLSQAHSLPRDTLPLVL